MDRLFAWALVWALRYVILTLILGFILLSIFSPKQPEPQVRRAILVNPYPNQLP